MKKIEIIGGQKLFGTVINQTSKNATLPILSASILARGTVEIRKLPKISDVDNMLKILRSLGAKITRRDNIVKIDSSHLSDRLIDRDLANTMRSSVFLLGSMLARFKKMDLYEPGGCRIGRRNIDIHISSLSRLGVKVIYKEEYISFDATKAKARRVRLRLPSVGATENLIQFAATLKGKTVILNPAREPEIVDLANFLNRMGAKILGAGTDKITIYGVDNLFGTIYTPIGDRIVAGTLMTAVALTGGDVTIRNAYPYQNEKFIEILRQVGCQINIKNDIIHISREKELSSNLIITTDYYPGFPTDLQSCALVLATTSKGSTKITEKIFEDRFLIVDELVRMGADIDRIDCHNVLVKGVSKLNGSIVEARDLRGGAALVLAGLVAEGITNVTKINYIERGYEDLVGMLKSLGATIRKK